MITGNMIVDTISSYEVVLDYGLMGVIIYILYKYNQRLMKKQDEREKKLFDIIEKIKR